MYRFVASACAILSVFVLASCGGGGGSTSSSTVTLSPSPLTATFQVGTSATLTVNAAVADPSVFTGNVYAVVVDSQKLLSGNVALTQVNANNYTATLHTSTALAAQRYQGSFQVQLCKDPSCTAQYPGSPIALPYDFTVAPFHAADQRRLLPSEWGVGLSSLPSSARLSRTLTISDNQGSALPWTAISDSPWLTVTASGTTGNGSSLVLTANPAALASDVVSYANVSVSTTTPGVQSALIRVGLWKGSADLAATAKIAAPYANLVADKIRPYVYANNGGTTVDVYNAYTTQKITSITGVGAALGQMSVSPNASLLYVLDTASSSMAVVDLTTQAKTATWPLSKPVAPSTSVLAIRPNAVDVVLVGDNGGAAYVAGKSLGNTGITGSLSASGNGRNVYSQNQGISPATVGAYAVDYTELSGGVLSVIPKASGISINQASNGQDIAVSLDGSHLYTASGSPYKCSQVDPTSLAFVGSLPGGDPYPNNVEVTVDGRVICGASGSSTDFWVHSSSGALLNSYSVGSGVLTGQLVTTPDGFVVIALTGHPFIAFVPIGQ